MKPYRTIPIAECGEPLVAIPTERFLLTTPHPYIALGAPYGDNSPWMLRTGALQALIAAQNALAQCKAGWRFKLFDAYRPNEVQAFMVNHEFLKLSGGRPPEDIQDGDELKHLWERTYRVWGIPSTDPATPPPHSTGAVVDLTIADEKGQNIWMGSPIDENSDRSNPDHFITSDPQAHANRVLLLDVMASAGFVRHMTEWWHFGIGDQISVWQENQRDPQIPALARYGRAALLPTTTS